MNWVRHGGSTTFETKSSYCRLARQALPCYTAVARLGFKRRTTAVLKSNLIRTIEFDTAVARRLKRALAIFPLFISSYSKPCIVHEKKNKKKIGQKLKSQFLHLR